MQPFLENVPLNFGETIYELNSPIKHVYFPESGILSVLGTAGNEKPVEVGLIGAEGLTGLSLFLGVPRSANEVIVQGQGTARRITAKAALLEISRGGVFHDSVLRFAHNLFLQISQTTSCNRHHQVDERLSRWLLMTRDRSPTDTLQLTQQFLSWMLGVRHQQSARPRWFLIARARSNTAGAS